ncbi:hypothetical protein [Virgibacillus siamensis]|uniref:hypothetical protein n=1 Tax=Virgibacillus siamensis TaxID=480071 RepID=UPI0015891C33|nr:hypothetical protein [Virgibacillus siamensis]
MEIIKGERSFDLDQFLEKPLFAHLSTLSLKGPRESPVWFFWKDECLWIIGTPKDTFPLRVETNAGFAVEY